MEEFGKHIYLRKQIYKSLDSESQILAITLFVFGKFRQSLFSTTNEFIGKLL